MVECCRWVWEPGQRSSSVVYMSDGSRVNRLAGWVLSFSILSTMCRHLTTLMSLIICRWFQSCSDLVLSPHCRTFLSWAAHKPWQFAMFSVKMCYVLYVWCCHFLFLCCHGEHSDLSVTNSINNSCIPFIYSSSTVLAWCIKVTGVAYYLLNYYLSNDHYPIRWAHWYLFCKRDLSRAEKKTHKHSQTNKRANSIRHRCQVQICLILIGFECLILHL